VAYGALHVTIAVLVMVMLVDGGRLPADQNGVVVVVGAMGWSGRLVLAVATAGLASFGVWQVYAAAAGFRWVSGGERTRKRVGAAGKAIAVTAVAVVGGTALFGGSTGDGDRTARTATATLLALPAGEVIVGAVAVITLIVAGSMVYTGVRATFLGDLREAKLSPLTRTVAIVCGSAGNLARAVALGGVGWSFGAAAFDEDPARSTGIDGVLRALASNPLGVVVLVLVAVGIAAFGLYCVIDAYARRA
jgi:hypothetical protein